MVKTSVVRIAQWGVFVTTPSISVGSSTINVAVDVDNASEPPVEVKVFTRGFLADQADRPTGDAAATSEPLALRIAQAGSDQVTNTAWIENPRLWGIKTPQRYVAETIIRRDSTVLDHMLTPFGIRHIEFAARGLVLNGEHVPVRGVCNHHDLGALDAAINVRALECQLDILRETGCNVIRTSHNPPAPELLELCDRMGFVVMDEAFGSWRHGKIPNDYSVLFPDWHVADLWALVRRDRNHPSVALWSIGNEIPEQTEPGGVNQPVTYECGAAHPNVADLPQITSV